MSGNKVYPNKKRVIRQANLVTTAIAELSGLAIQPLNVAFRSSNPKITVAHCPGTKKLQFAGSGQGRNSQGQFYLKYSAIICGCEIEWREVQNG